MLDAAGLLNAPGAAGDADEEVPRPLTGSRKERPPCAARNTAAAAIEVPEAVKNDAGAPPAGVPPEDIPAGVPNAAPDRPVGETRDDPGLSTGGRVEVDPTGVAEEAGGAGADVELGEVSGVPDEGGRAGGNEEAVGRPAEERSGDRRAADAPLGDGVDGGGGDGEEGGGGGAGDGGGGALDGDVEARSRDGGGESGGGGEDGGKGGEVGGGGGGDGGGGGTTSEAEEPSAGVGGMAGDEGPAAARGGVLDPPTRRRLRARPLFSSVLGSRRGRRLTCVFTCGLSVKCLRTAVFHSRSTLNATRME